MNRTTNKPTRKAKKSYTLSPESVAFLETMRRKHGATSMSSILEEILQSVRHQHQRAALEKAVGNYYGSLSDPEATEQIHWGDFSEREFPTEERS